MSTKPERLAELIRSGDADRIANEVYPLARRIAGHILNPTDSHLVDTAAGDAVLAICRYHHTFRGQSRASTWVYAITRRAAIRCVRRDARWYGQHLVSEPPSVSEANVPIGVTRREVAQEVARLIANPMWRRIWLLRNEPVKQRTHQEIARMTGYTVGSVAATLSKVRRIVTSGV